MGRFKNICFYLLLVYFVITLAFFCSYIYHEESCIDLLHKWEKGDIQDYYIEFSLNYRIHASELKNLNVTRCKSFFEALDYQSVNRPDSIRRLGKCDVKLLFNSHESWLDYLFGFTQFNCSVGDCIYEDGVLITTPYLDNNDKAGTHFIRWDYEESNKNCPAFRRFIQAITLKKEHDDEVDKEWQERMKKNKEQEEIKELKENQN